MPTEGGRHHRKPLSFAHYVDFPDYSTDELMAIATLILTTRNYRFRGDVLVSHAFQAGLIAMPIVMSPINTGFDLH